MSETTQVVLASGNKGKLREINQLLEGLHIHAVPQTQLGVTDVEETGLTFALTHTYSGYPAVKQAKQMVAEGRFGKIRKSRQHLYLFLC